MNLAADLLRWEHDHDRVVLIEADGTAYSYADLAIMSRRAAYSLGRAGVRRGARVALMQPNSIEYLAAYYGVLLLRAIPVPIPVHSTPEYCALVRSICDPVVGFTAHPGAAAVFDRIGLPCPRLERDALLSEGDVVDAAVDGPGSDIAQIIFTSGTTGSPKGVCLSHAAIASNTTGIVEYLGLRASDQVGVVLDFVYSYGNSLVQTHVRVGGSLALLGAPTFPREVVQRLAAARCTGFSGVPSTFAILLRQDSFRGIRLPSLRYITCAGGALPLENLNHLRAALPGVDVFPMYGQTEASARLSYLPPSELDRRPTSIGRGIPGVSLEVVRPDGSPVEPGEEGEIVARGPNLMSGYWGDPVATDQVLRGGWLWTGDLGVRDEEGFITITGRRSDLIKTAGYRIHPKEIEEHIVGLEGVHECAVVGVPDEVLGEAVAACFCPPTVPSLAAVRRHLRGRLPEHKWPRYVVDVDEFPRTTSGKVKRSELARIAAAKLRDESELSVR